MLLSLPTFHRSRLLELKLRSNRPQRLGIYAIDRSRPKTFYSKLACDLTKPEHTIEWKFPQTPGWLDLVFFDADTGQQPDIQIISKKLKPLRTQLHLLDMKTRSRIPFLMEFSRKAKYIEPPAIISDWNQKIFYFDVITNPDGSQEETPARVDDTYGAIDVGKEKIDLCSVFMLDYILFHEYAHFHKNNEFYDEFEADKNGLKIYLYSGHPYHDAMYAFTKIFNESDLNLGRTAALDSYIDEYKATGKIS